MTQHDLITALARLRNELIGWMVALMAGQLCLLAALVRSIKGH